MLRTKIEIPIFEYDIHIVLCSDFEQFFNKEELAFQRPPNSNACCLFTCFDEPVSYMLFNHDQEITHQMISHESNHAAFEICERKGIPITYDNQEVICYLQDYIFDRVVTRIKHHPSVKS
ncbi:MAG: hypothetical protein ABJI69_09180 [Balneola sp.]